MQLWPVENFSHHKRVPIALQVPFCDKKVFNWSELHFSEVTSYKTRILMPFASIAKIVKTSKQYMHSTLYFCQDCHEDKECDKANEYLKAYCPDILCLLLRKAKKTRL